jgi:hypothetical protein
MARPTNREEFKQFVLRRLGAPVIEINVDDTQLEDRIDEALLYYADYHYDGTEATYYKHQITAEDVTNKYITLPENIIGAVRIFDLGSSLTAGGFFNIQYQIALNDLYTLTSQSILPYYMAIQNLSVLQEVLVGRQPIRYNRHVNKLYIDMNWDKVQEGHFLIVEAYKVVDPDEFTDVWADRWLYRYATALIGVQWGSNLTKFANMSLPGGVQFNGGEILSRYQKEQDDLEQEMLFGYGLPPMDMVG